MSLHDPDLYRAALEVRQKGTHIKRIARHELAGELRVGHDPTQPFGKRVHFTYTPDGWTKPVGSNMCAEERFDTHWPHYARKLYPWRDTCDNLQFSFPKNTCTLIDMYTTYRVCFDKDKNHIEVTKMRKSLSPAIRLCYKAQDQLPDWIQRKLAVLNLIASGSIGAVGYIPEDIDNVGCVIDESTYWVYEVKDA